MGYLSSGADRVFAGLLDFWLLFTLNTSHRTLLLLVALYEWCTARASSSSNIYSSNIYRSSNIYSNFSLRYNLQLNYFDLVSWLPQWVFIVCLISALRLPLLHGSLAGTCRQWVNIALTDLKTLANRYGHCCQNGLIVVCLFGLEMLQLAYLHSWVFG